MQIDNNNYNNYNNRINFGARRIMSATKTIDGLSEKFEVYKLDECDIPFAKKLAIYMKNQKSRLNDAQRKLFEQLKEFVTNYDSFERPAFLGRDDKYKSLYIGIKNDEQITGYMLTKTKQRYDYTDEHSISDICPNVKDKVTEDTFLHAFFADKSLKGGFRSMLGSQYDRCRAFHVGSQKTDGARLRIAKDNPEYTFRASSREYYDLEDVLSIAEL